MLSRTLRQRVIGSPKAYFFGRGMQALTVGQLSIWQFHHALIGTPFCPLLCGITPTLGWACIVCGPGPMAAASPRRAAAIRGRLEVLSRLTRALPFSAYQRYKLNHIRKRSVTAQHVRGYVYEGAGSNICSDMLPTAMFRDITHPKVS